MKILVTGATGLLGSRLVYDLLKDGYDVRAIKRASSDLKVVDSHFKNNPDLYKKLEWVDGDILDIFSLETALQGIDKVYHCAAYVSFSPSDYEKMMQINITGTANLVNACLEAGVKKLCHVSSVAAIGRSLDGEHITEETLWQSSGLNSNYAISKYGAEREVWRGIAEGLDAVIVNPTIILGKGNWNEGSSSMVKKMYEGLKFYTKGVNGFVDVADVTKAMIQLMESDIKNERFILCSENLAYKDFFSAMAQHLKKQPPSNFAGPVLSEIGWRAEWLKSLFTGSKPLITKETARTANNRYYYSSEKIKQKLGMNFLPIDKSLEQLCGEFLAEHSQDS